MRTHPLGINLEDLMDMYRQSDRSYQPKAPIAENVKNIPQRPAPSDSSPAADALDESEGNSAIDKAMDFYDVS
jgi:hypothetical protein